MSFDLNYWQNKKLNKVNAFNKKKHQFIEDIFRLTRELGEENNLFTKEMEEIDAHIANNTPAPAEEPAAEEPAAEEPAAEEPAQTAPVNEVETKAE